MSDDLRFEFSTPVLRQDHGMRFHYLPLPADVGDALNKAGVRRVMCRLNGFETTRGVQGTGDGGSCLVTGMGLLRDVRAQLGDMVAVELWPDPSPDEIDLGEEFSAALEQDPEAAERFFAMTPGRKRSLAYYVTSAKRPETRIKRALELVYKIRTRGLYGDLQDGS